MWLLQMRQFDHNYNLECQLSTSTTVSHYFCITNCTTIDKHIPYLAPSQVRCAPPCAQKRGTGYEANSLL